MDRRAHTFVTGTHNPWRCLRCCRTNNSSLFHAPCPSNWLLLLLIDPFSAAIFSPHSPNTSGSTSTSSTTDSVCVVHKEVLDIIESLNSRAYFQGWCSKSLFWALSNPPPLLCTQRGQLFCPRIIKIHFGRRPLALEWWRQERREGVEQCLLLLSWGTTNHPLTVYTYRGDLQNHVFKLMAMCFSQKFPLTSSHPIPPLPLSIVGNNFSTLFKSFSIYLLATRHFISHKSKSEQVEKRKVD